MCWSPWLFFFFFFNKFIYFWLRWVFIAACRLSLVAVSGSYSLLPCVGFSLEWLLLLRSTGSRLAGSVVVPPRLQSTGSVVVAPGLSCSAACGIFPDQDSNPCPLHWQADSSPLLHQGSPVPVVFNSNFLIHILSLFFVQVLMEKFNQRVICDYDFKRIEEKTN